MKRFRKGERVAWYTNGLYTRPNPARDFHQAMGTYVRRIKQHALIVVEGRHEVVIHVPIGFLAAAPPATLQDGGSLYVSGPHMLALLRDVREMWDEAGLGEDHEASEALRARLDKVIGELEGE